MVDTIVSRGEFLTSYTPYQAEISQGTLAAIFEFQTMLCQLTGMDVANASMYDGSTAVPEAAMMASRITGRDRVLVSRAVHPEYREVLETYAANQELKVEEFGYDGPLALPKSGQEDLARKLDSTTAAVIVQSPNFFGVVEDLTQCATLAHASGALPIVHIFTEAVSLGLLEPCADSDIVAGELQSFAIAPSYGGPYAGVIATRERYMRQLPGRLVGQTRDARGRRAYCLTLATREQHIRREKATSNICTNQALFIALMATIFMTIYGKRGLRELAKQNVSQSHPCRPKLPPRFSGPFFNEFVVAASNDKKNKALLKKKIIGGLGIGRVLSRVERFPVGVRDGSATEVGARCWWRHMVRKVSQHISQNEGLIFEKSSAGKYAYQLPDARRRRLAFRGAGRQRPRDIADFPEVSEVEVIRHFTRLSTWNYGIDHGMYPLGSCTMKYNPKINEMSRVWKASPVSIRINRKSLSRARWRSWGCCRSCFAEITGMDAITLQPAAGAHGELTGILLVRAYLQSQGNPRKKILIPDSAHGTNPATAAIAGYKSREFRSNCAVRSTWRSLAKPRSNEDVAALMVTNPNTLGIFEENIAKAAEILHAKGAQLYMDGANMNALVGMARPGDFGVDVMHLNLHKTFSTPHGGGGPGSGPVAVKKSLEPFLPDAGARARGQGQAGRFEPQAQAVDRTRAGVLRQFRRAGARAGLHHGARRRRLAAVDTGRRSETRITSAKLADPVRPGLLRTDAA